MSFFNCGKAEQSLDSTSLKSDSFLKDEDSIAGQGFDEIGGAEFPPYSGQLPSKRYPSKRNQYSSRTSASSSKSSENFGQYEDWPYLPATQAVETRDRPRSVSYQDPLDGLPDAVEIEEVSPKDMIFYAKVLNAVGKALKRSITAKDADTIFCVKKPSDLISYIQNLIYTEATPECFVIAVIYIERYLHFNPNTELACSNVQLLYLTALTVAIKYNDDSYFNSAYYAQIGGLDSVKTLNRLELQFLFGLNFDLGVDSWEYKKLEDSLLGSRRLHGKRRSKRKKDKYIKSPALTSHRKSPLQNISC